MIVVADASVLVGELLRRLGRELLTHPELRVIVAEEQWDEASHELQRRLSIMAAQGRLTTDQAKVLYDSVLAIVDSRAIEVIPKVFYSHLEAQARRRVPRDPNDWAPVALAMALGVGILTGDHDFLGCGCPTWTVDTLSEELRGG